MKISEAYNKYQIMPQLAEHQLKVAAVAEMIISNIINPSSLMLDRQGIIKACLLHDMGNIIKFDFSKSKAYVNQDVDIPKWEAVKQEYIEKYGKDEHNASRMIAKELGVSERVIGLIDCINFEGATQNAAALDYGKKIVQYSDDRVSPKGVVSLEGRFQDLRDRYQQHRTESPELLNFENALREMEKQIFSKCKIKPEDITESTVRSIVEKLKSFEI